MGKFKRIAETENFTVDYDAGKAIYRVSYFQNNHFKDQCFFDAVAEAYRGYRDHSGNSRQRCLHCASIQIKKTDYYHNSETRMDDVSGQCSYWHGGECWGTKERQATDCGGFKSRCDKY